MDCTWARGERRAEDDPRDSGLSKWEAVQCHCVMGKAGQVWEENQEVSLRITYLRSAMPVNLQVVLLSKPWNV